MIQHIIDSPVGKLVITVANGRLARIEWADHGPYAIMPDSPASTTDARVSGEMLIDQLQDQFAAYFAGRRQMFDLPLVPAATSFQARVRTALLNIPYGTTTSYGALAQQIATAPRAVGQACGRNPLPIIIPCHRICAESGIGGYSGGSGVATKRLLLAHEAHMQHNQ